MKLKHLFAAALISIGLSFNANAALIKQSFDVEFQGTSATVKVGVLTENSEPSLLPELFWLGDAIEFISFSNVSLPGSTGPQSFTFAGADISDVFNQLEVVAYGDSETGPAGFGNGIREIFFDLNLNALSDFFGIDSRVTALIVNDDIDTTFEIFDFEAEVGPNFEFVSFFDIADADGFAVGSAVANDVQVNAPATALLAFLTLGGLLLRRKA